MTTASSDIIDDDVAPPTRKQRKRGFGSKLLRFALWVALILLLLIAIVLGLIYWLAGTDKGFAKVISIANDKVAGLSVDGAEGNLRTGFSATQISFANDAIDINASTLNSQWRLGCLKQRRFCLDGLHIDQLDITTSENENAEEPAPRDGPIKLPTVALPIELAISDISIDTLNFQAPGDVPVQTITDIRLSATSQLAGEIQNANTEQVAGGATQQVADLISNSQIDDLDNGQSNSQDNGQSNSRSNRIESNDDTQQSSAKGSRVQLSELTLTYQDFTAQAEGEVTLQGPYPLDLALIVTSDDVLPDSVAEGVGEQPLQLRTQLSNSVADLSIDAETSGIASLLLNGQLQPLEQDLPLSITLSSETLGWPLETQIQVLASDTNIVASGDLNDYNFTIATRLSGEQIPETAIEIEGVANTDRIDLPRLDINTLNGRALGSAFIGLQQSISWATQWQINNIDPSVQIPDLTGNLDAAFAASGLLDDGRWSLKLDEAVVAGTLRELPFDLNAKLEKGLNDHWFIERVILANDANTLQAQGVITDQIDIDAKIRLTQLQNFLPGLAGGFNADIDVEGDLQNPNIALDANADVIRFNDILVRTLNISADIEQLFLAESQLDIQVGTIRSGTNTISNTAVALAGSRAEHQLSLKADGPENTAINANISGALDEAFNWQGLLERVNARVPAHEITLLEPVAVQWQNDLGKLQISPHCWSLTTDSSLCLDDTIESTGTGDANIALSAYPLKQANDFLPDNTKLNGELSADVLLSWGENGPSDRGAKVAVTINNAGIQTLDALGDRVELSYQRINLNANVKESDIRASMVLDSQTLGTAELQMQFDPSNPESNIEGDVQLQGLRLDIAKAFLPDFEQVSGTISAQGRLQGTIKAPEYNGNVVLDSPQLQAEILPLPVTGGNITANINGQNLRLSGEILSDEGRVGISGRGSLDPQNWNAEVSLTGENLNLRSDPLQESSVNHDIRIQANAKRLFVSGDIDIPRAVINVEALPQGARTVSSDVIIIEDEEEQLQQTDSDATTSALETAVALNISLGDDVTVSAYGLNANLAGDMDVSLRGDKPVQLGGEILVKDGIFKKYGQDLSAEGQVLFVGPVDGTRLDIEAVREIDTEDRTAGLRIEGTVTEPELALFTEPADKSQDAILSYVILGRDINQASDQEADLLATAMLALAVKGGNAVGTGVAGALGIQEFGIETRGSGDDTELIVSGRLNDRLLLRYGRGAFDAESTLYLRYDLTKKLYLEAAQGTQQAVDLFYSFAF